MVDEVEIRNVGGDGNVASEETLARLVKSIEEFAKKSGMNPASETAKAQAAYSRTLKEDIKSIEEKIEAQEEYTGALRTSARALSAFGSGLLGLVSSGFGAVAGSLTNFAETVMGNDESLSGLARSIPIFGSVIERFTDVIDDSFDSFQSMATSGASFAYDLGELRNASRELRLDFNELTGFVQQNSTRLAAFGGTVDAGIRQQRALSEAMGSDLREQFIAMGLTSEELNEQLALYQFLTRAGSRQEQMSLQGQVDAAASLTKNMLTLSKLTGQDIKQKRDAMAQAQMDMAFQMEMARLTPEQRAAMQEALNQAQVMGQDAVDAVKREFLGMPPLTEAQAIYASTQSELVQELSGMVRDVRGIRNEQDLARFQSEEAVRERLADLFEAQIQAASRSEAILRAGAAGMDGVAATMAEQFGTTAEFVGQFLRENADGSIGFAREEFLRSMEEAGNELIPPGGELDAIASFREGLREAREAITENLTNPLITMLMSALTPVTESFQSFVGEDGTNTLFQTSINLMREKIEAIVPKITQFMDAFAADPEQAIADVVSDIGNFFRDAIFGEMINVGGDDPSEVRMERQGGLVQVLRDAISALFADDGVLQSLTNGIGTVTDGLVTGFRDFWNDPATSTMREDIKNMFERIIDEIVLMIADNTWFLGGRAEEIRTRRAEQEIAAGAASSTPESRAGAAEVGTLADDQAEAALAELNAYEQRVAELVEVLNDTRSEIAEMKRVSPFAFTGTLELREQELIEQLRNLGVEGYNQGTNGFEDFGKGTLAMLHGREAVIPLDSPLGKLLNELGSTQATGGTNLETMISNLTNALQGNTTNQVSSLETMISNLTNALQGNTANQVSSEALQELNTTMQHVLAELRQTRIIEERIERNTSSMGGNIANGRVSYIR